MSDSNPIPPVPKSQELPPAPPKPHKPPPLPKSGMARSDSTKPARYVPPPTRKPSTGTGAIPKTVLVKAVAPPPVPNASAAPAIPNPTHGTSRASVHDQGAKAPDSPPKADRSPGIPAASVPEAPALPPPPPELVEQEIAVLEPEVDHVCGYEADPARRTTVYHLAIGLALASVFSAIPAGMDIADHLRSDDSPGVSQWAFLLTLVAGVQIAYAVYLVQMPDWGTVWVASLLTLLLATVYAMLLGVFLLANDESQIIHWMGLSDQLRSNRAAGWCVIMLCLSCLMAYTTGRVSVRWYNAFHLVIEAQTPRNSQ